MFMQNRPNVLLISCHDLGQHLGCYGIETVDTPHIDRLAEQGVRFSRSFCVNPGCSPSRASLATGRYPHSHGVMGLTHGLFAWALHEGEVHLQARFEQAGYHTALLGVCHEVREPQKLGFSEYLRPTREHPEQARAMTLAASAEQFLAGRRDGAEPFYLQLGFFEPHREPGHPTHWPATHRPARRQVTVPPYLVDDAGAREELAYFEASVRTVDDAMGRILAALDENGLADDTLVVFTADHGIPFPRAKCSVYNPGLEVPLILRWPNGPWQAGAVLDELISNVDYLPTLCDLLDLPRADNHQGFSYAPLLRGRSQRRASSSSPS
jgi:arylsulfatase A-like enzyme